MSTLKRYYIVLLLVIAIFPVNVFGEERYIESKDLTIYIKDQPTETVVDDQRGILTKTQIEAIKKAGKELQLYDIALYVGIEDSYPGDFGSHVNYVAEKEYDFLLDGKENGIVIVFNFYKDGNSKYEYSVFCNGDLGIVNEQMILSQISISRFEDTDSRWITNSFKKVVQRIKKEENKLINADKIAAEKKLKRENIKFLIILIVALMGFPMTLVFILLLCNGKTTDINLSIIDMERLMLIYKSHPLDQKEAESVKQNWELEKKQKVNEVSALIRKTLANTKSKKKYLLEIKATYETYSQLPESVKALIEKDMVDELERRYLMSCADYLEKDNNK